jgi:hypothetical protein
MHAPSWNRPAAYTDNRTSETYYYSSPAAIRRATGGAQMRAPSNSTSSTPITFGQITSAPLTTVAQDINLEEVVTKIGDDIREIESEYMAPRLPTEIEV